MKRRNFILLLGGTGSAALGTGTGAFSSASADRSVEVSVVEDGSAYVGYEALPDAGEAGGDAGDAGDESDEKSMTVENGERVRLVQVTNRFPGDAGIGVVGVDFGGSGHLFSDLEVERSDDGGYEQMTDREVRRGPFERGGPVDPENAFTPGEYADVTAVVDGDPKVYETIEVTVQVRGTAEAGLSAKIFGDTRAFSLTVEEADADGASDVSGVAFGPGKSGVVIEMNESDTDLGAASTESDESEGRIDATVYYEDGDVVRSARAAVPANEELKAKRFDDSLSNGKRIVGVAVDGIDGVFAREQTSAPGNSENNNGSVSETVPPGEASFSDDLVDD